MTEKIGTSAPLSRRQRKQAIVAWEAQRLREQHESLAVLKARRRVEHSARLARRVWDLWPLWLGLIIGILGPVLQYLATAVGDWCMILVFPFVVLAKRPELQVGRITHFLPTLMLYAQFPIEGLLAHIVLRRDVRPLGVVGQVLLFHGLGLVELWLVTSTSGFNFLRP